MNQEIEIKFETGCNSQIIFNECVNKYHSNSDSHFKLFLKTLNICWIDMDYMSVEDALDIAKIGKESSQKSKPIFKLEDPKYKSVFYLIVGHEDEIINKINDWVNLQAFV